MQTKENFNFQLILKELRPAYVFEAGVLEKLLVNGDIVAILHFALTQTVEIVQT